jgi:hypothetical protein
MTISLAARRIISSSAVNFSYFFSFWSLLMSSPDQKPQRTQRGKAAIKACSLAPNDSARIAPSSLTPNLSAVG